MFYTKLRHNIVLSWENNDEIIKTYLKYLETQYFNLNLETETERPYGEDLRVITPEPFHMVSFLKYDSCLYLIPNVNEIHEEFGSELPENSESDTFLCNLLEDALCNGWEDVNSYEHDFLTDATLLSDSLTISEFGEFVKADVIYKDEFYAIRSSGRELFEGNCVEFKGYS